MRPNFSGLWRLNLEKSRLSAVARLVVKIEHDEPHFVQQVKTVLSDGSVSHACYKGETGGAEFENNTERGRLYSTAIWQGDELVIDSNVKTQGGVFHFRDYWFLSEDGTELRMEHRDDALAGQLAVLERATEQHGA